MLKMGNRSNQTGEVQPTAYRCSRNSRNVVKCTRLFQITSNDAQQRRIQQVKILDSKSIDEVFAHIEIDKDGSLLVGCRIWIWFRFCSEMVR